MSCQCGYLGSSANPYEHRHFGLSDNKGI
jgi:hypothetical protein